jgi:NADH-quinone oxidoreductase subunit A
MGEGRMASQYLPVLMVLAIAVVTAAVLLGLAALVGQRNRSTSAIKHETYESGMPLLDRGWKRIPVKFYIVALVFVVLDVEVAFLYPWAITYRELLAEQALTVLWDMLAFIAFIAFAYIYLWKQGIFDWGRKKPPKSALSDRGDQ